MGKSPIFRRATLIPEGLLQEDAGLYVSALSVSGPALSAPVCRNFARSQRNFQRSAGYAFGGLSRLKSVTTLGRRAQSLVGGAGQEWLEAEQPRKAERDARQCTHRLLRRNFIRSVQWRGQHGLRLGELGSGVDGAHGGLFINTAW